MNSSMDRSRKPQYSCQISLPFHVCSFFSRFNSVTSEQLFALGEKGVSNAFLRGNHKGHGSLVVIVTPDILGENIAVLHINVEKIAGWVQYKGPEHLRTGKKQPQEEIKEDNINNTTENYIDEKQASFINAILDEVIN